MRTVRSIIRIVFIFVLLIPAFIKRPKRTFHKGRLALKSHKPAWYYFSLPKAYRKRIGDGYKIRLARKHLFKNRAA